MVAPPATIPAPIWTDDDLVPYGLLSAADITPVTLSDNDRPRLGGVQYNYRCDPVVDTWPAPCDEVPDGLTKSRPGGMDLITGTPVVTYGFETCSLVDYTEDQTRRLAEESLRRIEQGTLETALWAQLAARTGTAILADTPLGITDALALAEWWLGRQQVRGMVHVNSINAAMAAGNDLLYPNRDGNARRYHATPLGHRWVFGGGYGFNGPAGNTVPSAENTGWMFVTRMVHLYRGPIDIQSGMLYRANEHDARAERIWVPVVPCAIAAIPIATVVNGDCEPIPIPTPALTLTATPTTGTAPLDVTAVVENETPPVSITWGDETP